MDNAGSVVPEVTLSMAYDYEGNRVMLGDSQGGQVWYAWNNQRLQSMVMYTGNYKSAQVGFGYDSVGRLASLTRTANWDFATTINTSYTLDLLNLYPIGFSFTDHWLGHMALEVSLPDGTIFYVDNGWWGKNPIFFPKKMSRSMYFHTIRRANKYE